MKKRADGLYQKQITIIKKGVKTQKCFYGKTIAAVNKKIIDYSGQAERGRLFSEVADEWWDEHKQTLASNSLKPLFPSSILGGASKTATCKRRYNHCVREWLCRLFLRFLP